MRTLVIILAETRMSQITFQNIQKNLILPFAADLAVCIGVKSNYNCNNHFYNHAKYRFLYPEPEDWADAFDYASSFIENQEINWREFLKIKDQFLGGIKGPNSHPGSAGILIFFRWFLLKNLLDNDLISQYDRFIITRSDFMFTLQHPINIDPSYIWIPNSESYGGFTDRHVILGQNNITSYLNILPQLFTENYFSKMSHETMWNLEKLIKFHLEQQNCIDQVRFIPYIMYSIRNAETATRWSTGTFNVNLGYFIKYSSEYSKSNEYKALFKQSRKNLDSFYLQLLRSINPV